MIMPGKRTYTKGRRATRDIVELVHPPRCSTRKMKTNSSGAFHKFKHGTF